MKFNTVIPCLTIIVMTLGFAKNIYAQESAQQDSHLGLTAKLDMEFGGDAIADVYFTNGSTQSVKAGQGLGFGIGAHYRPASSKFDFSSTIGYKYVTTQASNVDIHLKRTVLELRADYFLSDTVWIGAGPVWHTGIEFDAGGIGNNLTFDNARGFSAKVGWKFIALSYTGMDYKDEFGYSYNANSFGVSFIGRF